MGLFLKYTEVKSHTCQFNSCFFSGTPDPSIFTYLLNDVSKLIGGAPLSSIYSDEDYNMVMESQVGVDRP